MFAPEIITIGGNIVTRIRDELKTQDKDEKRL